MSADNSKTSLRSEQLKICWRQHGVRIVCILLIVGLLFASKYLYIYL